MSDVKIVFSADTRAATETINRFRGAVVSQMQQLAGAVAAAFAVDRLVRGFAQAVTGAIQLADETGKTAQKIGVSTEALSAYTYAAKLANVEQGELTTSMRALAQNVTEAARGQAEAAGAFQRLQVGVRDANGELRNIEQILPEIANAFADMPDGITKTALATQLFGRSGMNMIPMLNEGAAGLERAAKEAQSFGRIIKFETAEEAAQFNDNITRMKENFGGLAGLFAREILPALVRLTDWLVQSMKGAEGSSSSIRGLVNVLKWLAMAIGSVIIVAQSLERMIGSALRLSIGSFLAAVQTAINILVLWQGSFQPLIHTVKELGKSIGDLAQLLVQVGTGDWLGAWETAQKLFGDTKDTLQAMGQQIAANFQITAELVHDFLEDIWEDTKGTSKEIIEGLKRDWASIEKLFHSLFDAPEKRTPRERSNEVPPAEAVLKEDTLKMLQRITEEYRAAYWERERIFKESFQRQLEAVRERIMAEKFLDEEALEDDWDYITAKFQLEQLLNKQLADLAAERVKTEEEMQRRLARARHEEINNRIRAAEANRNLTQNQRGAIIRSEIETQLAANREMQFGAETDLIYGPEEERIAAYEKLIELRREEIELATQLQNIDRSFGTTFSQGITRLYDEWSSLGQNLANGVITSLQMAIDGLANSVTGLINGTRTWGQVWQQVGNQVINMILRIVLQWIAAQIIGLIFGKAATATTNQMAMSSTTSWQPAAYYASVATYGAAAGVGATALESAANLTYAAGIARSGAGSAFEKGGLVRGGQQQITVNEKGEEFVVNTPATRRFRPFLERINAGVKDAMTAFQGVRNRGAGVQPVTSNEEYLASEAPGLRSTGQAASPQVHVEGHKANIVMLRDENELRRYLESEAGKNTIIHTVRDNKNRIGLET